MAEARSEARKQGGPVGSEHPIRDVVSRLEGEARDGSAAFGDLVRAFGATSFAPALMIPAILVISPLSGVPLFSSLCGLTIALIAAQMIGSRHSLWLPGFVAKREVAGDRLSSALRRTRRAAEFLDRLSRPERLSGLPGRGDPRVVGALALLCGGLMPFLELVPFSSSLLGAAVLCFSIGLLTRDGLFSLLGLGFMAAGAFVPVFLVTELA